MGRAFTASITRMPCACTPTIPDVLDPDAGTPESSLDTAVPEDGADVENKGDPAPPEPEPVFTVETGEWFFRRVEMVSDPCDWKPFLDDLPDGLADVLPTSFDVDSRDGGSISKRFVLAGISAPPRP